jgi:DNA-binding response OmpR family regulator
MAANKRILICDDDPLLVDLLDYRLTSRGYDVVIARDGGEAMERLQESVPDAIVLDAMMPVADGYEVLRRIREDEALAAIPVIMLTARKQERDIVQALELGASDYIVKPFIPEELVARLGRLLGTPR